MFSRNRYSPQYVPAPRPRRPGCPGCVFLVAAFVLICWVMLASGTFATLSKPLISLPLSSFHVPSLHLPSLGGVVQAAQDLQHPQESYTVTGTPRLSAKFINDVLASAHSPAAGTGQALYDLSVTYGIDDAYALAFFQHESTFGTGGMAKVTLSLGNIRCSVGYTCINGYRAYQSWPQGYADWYRLIRTLYIGQWHLTTVPQIIPVYAPSSDHNDVAAYIGAVEYAVDAWRRESQG